MTFFKVLINFTIFLALVVIALGAYTRLTDAGLGCPDWPGCYGKLIAPLHDDHIAQAQQKFPEATIEPHKAHNEMMHRYVAGLLGFCVLAITLLCFKLKRHRLLGTVLLALVVFQAALGMWTVTLSLLPLVVLAHLFGGFAVFALLALLRADVSLREQPLQKEPELAKFLPLGYLALAVLLMQIALGGWTSSNYAATVCYQLPFCESGWQERFSLTTALHMPSGHETYEFGVLPYEGRMSIHVMHRIGAIVTLSVLGIFIYFSWHFSKEKMIRNFALAIGFVLLLQFTLGIINVVAQLPLLNAVAHNVVAANLLMLMVVFLRHIYLRRPVLTSTAAVATIKKSIVTD